MSSIIRDGKYYRAVLDDGSRVYLGTIEQIVKNAHSFKIQKSHLLFMLETLGDTKLFLNYIGNKGYSVEYVERVIGKKLPQLKTRNNFLRSKT